jgi:hypothetical protein
MPSPLSHAPRSLCRNRLTRSPWAIPLLLLITSPLTRGLAITGTLAFGTGCSEPAPTIEACTQWQIECVDTCGIDNFEACLWACEDDHAACLDDAYYESERRAETAEGLADAGVACLAVTACTLESLGDGDGDGDDGDGDDWSEPEPEPDDWGEDWGEQVPADPSELQAVEDPGAVPLDLPAG